MTTLPMLLDGEGYRDERCARYGGCFDRWAARRGSVTGWAHCVPDCAHHVTKPPRWEPNR